ncbi:MAG: AAA family ATPase [Candidatus Margulisbacteria bacterium]|jgi:hypothetical protein|nr:AAA family ATPase [Candidatus Margulisiibacteriota bacterium]
MMLHRKVIGFNDKIYSWQEFDRQRKLDTAQANNKLNALLKEGKNSGDKILQSLQSARLTLSILGLLPKVVCVISFKGGVGKTTYLCNLALDLIRKGARVLIIDGDAGGADVSLALNHKIAAANKLFRYCYAPDRRNYLLDVYSLTGAGAGLTPGDITLLDDPAALAEAYYKFFAGRINKRNYDIVLLDSGGGNLRTLLPVAALSAKIITLYTNEPTSRLKAWETIFNIAVRWEEKHYYPVYLNKERPGSLLNWRGVSSAEQKTAQNEMQAIGQKVFQPIFRPPYRPQSQLFLYPQSSLAYDPLLGATPILEHPWHASRGIDFMANVLLSDLGIKTANTGNINYGAYLVEE